MSASEVKIDGVTVVLARNSLMVDQRIEERSVGEFIVIDRAGTASYKRGQPIAIYDPDSILVFGGFIDSVGLRSMSPSGSGLYHHIMCMDNHYLADKRLVVESYQNELAGDIVKDIRTKYLAAEGITIGEIQDGVVIKEAVFNYVKPSEAYDAVAELAGFTWLINELKQLYFIDRATNVAPFSITASDMLKNSAFLTKGNPKYRNRQYVIGGTGITDLQTEDRTGDGEIRAFAMGYPLAKVPAITEDAAPKTVGIKGIDTGKDWYWNKGDNVIYAEIAPGIGVAVQCKYYGQYPLISSVEDSMEIEVRKAIEGGTGLIEDIVHEAQHESSDASKESAKGKLTNYAHDAEKFTFQTHRSGLAPGQLLPVTYSPFGFSSYDMLIESVVLRSEGGLLTYDVSAITGPALKTWSQFFSSILARQEKSIRIGDSLLIVLLQQKEDLSLVEATDIHSDAPPTYRELARTGVAHELLPLSEATSYWTHEKGKYCYAPKTNGAGLREGRYGFATYG